MTAPVSSAHFVDACTQRGLGPWLGVPCSFLQPFIDYVIDRPDAEYLAATNEGEALAIAAGSWLGGRLPVVMLQNSGLGNLVNPAVSLSYPFRIPALLIVTLRGEPGRPDEPQHELMGLVTESLLDTLRIAHAPFPASAGEVAAAVERAVAHMRQTGHPFAFVLRKGVVPASRPAAAAADTAARAAGCPTRREALAAIADAISDATIVVATTGKTGREWFELGDRPRNLYLVGAMGCAPSVALGLARETRHPVLCIDGDGAALMRLEGWASIGHQRPPHLVHVVLDNEAYDSTGAQRTISGGVDFPAVARALGYPSARSIAGAAALGAEVRAARATPGPHLLHCRIRLGASPELGRPGIPPREVAQRLRSQLAP